MIQERCASDFVLHTSQIPCLLQSKCSFSGGIARSSIGKEYPSKTTDSTIPFHVQYDQSCHLLFRTPAGNDGNRPFRFQSQLDAATSSGNFSSAESDSSNRTAFLLTDIFLSFSRTSSNITSRKSPSETTSSTLATRSSASSLMWQRASFPGKIVTKHPKGVIVFTGHWRYILPTSGSATIPSIISIALATLLSSGPFIWTLLPPSITIMLSHPHFSVIDLIVLPAGPISSIDLFLGMEITSMRGAYCDRLTRGCSRHRFISLRI
mmetsp:Transcript_7704/g.27467  ORF Transcript_7704/g.27467 Transcript_7704/m.27467 type:complete len:265 (-) Transcript_7704:566-1360(-)